MEQLVLFRAIQGLLSWRWVFYINIPFGLLSAFLLIISLKEPVERKKHAIDYIGSATLTAGIVALLFAMLQGGVTWSWASAQSLGLFALAVAFLLVFVLQEMRAPEPILPLTLFKNRIISISSIGGFILGVVLFGITSYVPLFVQGVKGGTATSAGITLGPLLLAWPIAATLSSKLIIRVGYRLTAGIGAFLVVVGVGMVMLFQVNTGLPFIVVAMLVIGSGLGLMSTAFVIAVQNAVPWNLRGVATASTQFVRTIGGTVGVALMGTILNTQMAQLFAPIFARYPAAVAHLPQNIAPSNVLLTPNVRQALPVDFLTQLQTALAQSLFWVYLLTFALAVIGLAAMFLFPGGRPEQYSYKAGIRIKLKRGMVLKQEPKALNHTPRQLDNTLLLYTTANKWLFLPLLRSLFFSLTLYACTPFVRGGNANS